MIVFRKNPTKSKTKPQISATHSSWTRKIMTKTSWEKISQDVTLLPLTFLLRTERICEHCVIYAKR